ncbi:MAG: exosome complex RNA-binding protein Rrp4 [Nanoarchaeota archaeon]
MTGLIVQDKTVVVPGEVIAEGIDYLPSYGSYREQDKIMASQLGLLNIDGKVLKIIPLAGRYLPRRNDVIIAKVVDILMTGWRLEINSPYTAVLNLKDASFDYIARGADLSKYFNLEDYMVTKIVNVTSQNIIDVSCKGPGLRGLRGGRVIRVSSCKVPRIIGKKGSMVSMIKRATGCQITVGQNGFVWINGEPDKEILVVEVINKVQREAHIQGLTERIQKFLEEKTGNKIEIIEEKDEYESSEQSEYSQEN